MSILGIGNDILVTARMSRFLAAGPKRTDRFARRILHAEHELPQFRLLYQDPAKSIQFLASTWAAKEAMYKSLSNADQQQCLFNKWYRSSDPQTGQRIITCDEFRRNNPNQRLLISVSHDGDYTSAICTRLEYSKVTT